MNNYKRKEIVEDSIFFIFHRRLTAPTPNLHIMAHGPVFNLRASFCANLRKKGLDSKGVDGYDFDCPLF